MSRLGPRAAACEQAAMAVFADSPGAVMSTRALEDATGYGIRHGQLMYGVLTRLHRLGHAGKSGGRRSESGACLWRWWPNEATCDLAVTAEPALCPGTNWSMCESGGCQGCRLWARSNLTAAPGKESAT